MGRGEGTDRLFVRLPQGMSGHGLPHKYGMGGPGVALHARQVCSCA